MLVGHDLRRARLHRLLHLSAGHLLLRIRISLCQLRCR